MARTSSTTVNRSESRHPYHLIIGRKFNLSPLSVMFIIGFFGEGVLFLLLFLFCFCFFLGLHPQHMEVPRLGVKLELQLPAYSTSTATWNLSLIWAYTTADSNARFLTLWAKPGIEPASSWILFSFITHWAIMGTPWWIFQIFPPHSNVSEDKNRGYKT